MGEMTNLGHNDVVAISGLAYRLYVVCSMVEYHVQYPNAMENIRVSRERGEPEHFMIQRPSVITAERTLPPEPKATLAPGSLITVDGVVYRVEVDRYRNVNMVPAN